MLKQSEKTGIRSQIDRETGRHTSTVTDRKDRYPQTNRHRQGGKHAAKQSEKTGIRSRTDREKAGTHPQLQTEKTSIRSQTDRETSRHASAVTDRKDRHPQSNRQR